MENCVPWLTCLHSLHTFIHTTLSSIAEEQPKTRLECLLSFPLFGRVAALASASLPGSRRDSLLVGFDEGKLSICEYDPQRHDLNTVSMHMFEEDEMRVWTTRGSLGCGGCWWDGDWLVRVGGKS